MRIGPIYYTGTVNRSIIEFANGKSFPFILQIASMLIKWENEGNTDDLLLYTNGIGDVRLEQLVSFVQLNGFGSHILLKNAKKKHKDYQDICNKALVATFNFAISKKLLLAAKKNASNFLYGHPNPKIGVANIPIKN